MGYEPSGQATHDPGWKHHSISLWVHGESYGARLSSAMALQAPRHLSQAPPQPCLRLPLNPFPLPLEQAGEGEPWGLMTGAKALFCLTAGKTEEENGRMEDVLEEPTVGLDDMTGKQRDSLLQNRAHPESQVLLQYPHLPQFY